MAFFGRCTFHRRHFRLIPLPLSSPSFTNCPFRRRWRVTFALLVPPRATSPRNKCTSVVGIIPIAGNANSRVGQTNRHLLYKIIMLLQGDQRLIRVALLAPYYMMELLSNPVNPPRYSEEDFFCLPSHPIWPALSGRSADVSLNL